MKQFTGKLISLQTAITEFTLGSVQIYCLHISSDKDDIIKSNRVYKFEDASKLSDLDYDEFRFARMDSDVIGNLDIVAIDYDKTNIKRVGGEVNIFMNEEHEDFRYLDPRGTKSARLNASKNIIEDMIKDGATRQDIADRFKVSTAYLDKWLIKNKMSTSYRKYIDDSTKEVIREKYRNGKTRKELSEEYDISTTTIGVIVKGINKKAIRKSEYKAAEQKRAKYIDYGDGTVYYNGNSYRKMDKYSFREYMLMHQEESDFDYNEDYGY